MYHKYVDISSLVSFKEPAFIKWPVYTYFGLTLVKNISISQHTKIQPAKKEPAFPPLLYLTARPKQNHGIRRLMESPSLKSNFLKGLFPSEPCAKRSVETGFTWIHLYVSKPSGETSRVIFLRLSTGSFHLLDFWHQVLKFSFYPSVFFNFCFFCFFCSTVL